MEGCRDKVEEVDCEAEMSTSGSEGTMEDSHSQLGSSLEDDPQRMPTVEELIAENRQLKEENSELRASLELAQEVFKKDWDSRMEEYRRMGWEMSELLQEEEELQLTVLELKQEAEETGMDIREKEEEIQILRRRVAKLTAQPKGDYDQEKDGQDREVVGEKAAIAIFPDKVWRLILGNLSEPEHLWNCCNTSKLFEDILHPWKTGWMLAQALPHLYRHLPGKKLLECRMICKGWNLAVDRFLEDHPSRRPHNPDQYDPRRLDIVMPTREKEIGPYPQYFFQYDTINDENGEFVRMHDRNLFIGREVMVTHYFLPNGVIEDTQELGEWWNGLFKFLELYGKDIWYLSLNLPCYDNDWSEQKLLELLNTKLFQQLPNLRRLFIEECSVEFPIVNPGKLSLPHAPSLETLAFPDTIGPGYHSIFDALLNRYNLQVRKLELAVDTWRSVSHLAWPNLTDLRLAGVGSETDLSVTGIPCGLTRIALYCSRRLFLQSLLDFVNGLSSSTQLSTLRLEGIIDFTGPLLEPHTDGSVKTLELIRSVYDSHSVLESCGNLIGGFPFIENVSICFSNSTCEPSESEIALASQEELAKHRIGANAGDKVEMLEVEEFMYSGEMYESNVWDMLPHLKVFTFQWDIFTREGYEAYARAQQSHGEVCDITM